MSSEIDYARWYPDVPPVMDTRQLAELLNTNEQIVRAYARDGLIPAHRLKGGRKFTFLRHEIFQWLLENRYEPGSEFGE
ncbi:MAG TPA: DNA-binding protein [Actinobacteria bacterium]|nr:helix-turn-helix domain protein [bacterium BMS3Bbin01]HDH26720.1 DNA-binding protein [Actinomycetota bacterium]